MDHWRLLDTGRMTAARNMALDEVLLKVKANGMRKGISVPNTIRLLQMSSPAVLIGFNQNVEQEVRTSFCRERSIDINRRITGGGAIYFDESQLGWEMICDRSFMNMSVANVRFFERASRPLIQSLRTLGIHADFRPLNDIEVNGRKISGTGGTEWGDAFLFQGTLLTDFDVDTMLRSLRIPIEKLKDKELASVRERVTCLAWELGTSPETDELKTILINGFQDVFGITLEPGGLTAEESRLLEEKLEYFSSDGWINKIKLPSEEQQTISAIHKAKGGLIRISLVINLRFRRIQSALITGDFFAYPQRGIFDLEAVLRNIPAEMDRITEIVTGFFEKNEVRIPGVAVSDLLYTMGKALGKIEITSHGIPLHFTNHLYTVGGTFGEILSKNPSHLLLPYCAKSMDCGWRFEEDCPLCGECSIEDAVSLGERFGLEHITIQSFEHLMETLERLKERGITSYIGCCCEAFYTKHNDDFERSGVPAILVDIDDTTCYDLGKEHDAYQGKFESQTAIKLELLAMVLNALPERRAEEVRKKEDS